MGTTLEKLCWTSLTWSGVIASSRLSTSPREWGEVHLNRAKARSSNARFGEAPRARLRRTLAQVDPPGRRQTDRIESKIDNQRQLRSTGDGNRLAEAARDQIAATGADRADESKCGAALDARGFQGKRPAGFALAPRFTKIFLAEDRRDHPIGRAVADSGRDEKDQEHREEAGKILGADEVQDTDGDGGHRDEIPERHDRAADLVSQQAAKRTRHRADQRPEKCDRN